MTKRHAEIVGAGFAGLTAACALAQRGWSVRVHERADRLRTTGAGIYIYENGLRVLEAVGAYAAATHGAPFAHTREVRDDQNRVISVHRWQGSRVFSIVRQTVINALAESATLSGAEIVLNSTAVSVTPNGELTMADGRALVHAFLLGFEVETTMASVMNPPHYEKGFHATGTLGTMGAAAAAARLLGLDAAQTRAALAVAASQASGSRKTSVP